MSEPSYEDKLVLLAQYGVLRPLFDVLGVDADEHQKRLEQAEKAVGSEKVEELKRVSSELTLKTSLSQTVLFLGSLLSDAGDTLTLQPPEPPNKKVMN